MVSVYPKKLRPVRDADTSGSYLNGVNFGIISIMNRAERLREYIAESGSPIANYSTNQRMIKAEIDGKRKFSQSLPRKLLMSDRRKSSRLQGAQQYEDSKIERISDRVRAAFEGYDGFDPIILDREIAYLKRNGVDIQTVLETSSSED